MTQYLQDRLPQAIEMAGKMVVPSCGDLQPKLTEFVIHRNKGNEAAQNKHVPEAAKEFGEAVRIDDYIAKGRSSIPGRQMRQQLARMEYLLALDAKGDDQLPNRARHLSVAYRADPENDLAKKELDKCYDHARQLFKEAYAEKGVDKETAVKLFRIVFNTLPDSDETKAKAKHWIDDLTKHP